MFQMEICTDGAAFKDPYTGEENKECEAYAIADILLKISKSLKVDGRNSGVLMDVIIAETKKGRV
ncbi:MAG: hypothetical protein ACI4EO_01900 [Blautia sp.]